MLLPLFITISIRLAFCCNLFFHCFPLTEELCLNGTNCIYIYPPLFNHEDTSTN
jgi:hypothetical protein